VAVESGLIGSDLQFFASVETGQGSNFFAGTGASYSLAWSQYNSANDTYTIDFQIFNASGATASNPDSDASSSVMPLLSLGGVTSFTDAPAWFFGRAGTDSSGNNVYAAAIAEPNATTNSDYIQVQRYTVNGATDGGVLQIDPNLSAFAPGATDLIVQEPDPSGNTGASNALLFITNNGANTGLSFAWNDIVTDSTGSHDQVEFAIQHNGAVTSQSEFQIADGDAHPGRQCRNTRLWRRYRHPRCRVRYQRQ
jgi:hypothetical protein